MLNILKHDRRYVQCAHKRSDRNTADKPLMRCLRVFDAVSYVALSGARMARTYCYSLNWRVRYFLVYFVVVYTKTVTN